MLDAFGNLLCLKLCQHNWHKPTQNITQKSASCFLYNSLAALVRHCLKNYPKTLPTRYKVLKKFYFLPTD